VREPNQERQRKIVELIRERGFARNSELSELLAVSTVTIRQDLEKLQVRGVVKKTFGGAMLDSDEIPDSAFAKRAATKRDEKERIGAAAAAMIQPNETILLDAGTTTTELARRLPENVGLTVVTCALNVALEAGARAGVTVVVCGGELNFHTLSVVGHHAQQALSEVHAHRVFLGTYSVDCEKGLGEHNFPGAQIKRALIAAARQVVLVCDSTKFREPAPVIVAPLDVIHHVITDRGIPAHPKRYFRRKGVPIEVV
jgi:DeoR/GlpR family transcriptional regulator of sugar metabolism